MKNVLGSATDVLVDTAVNGTISAISGKLAYGMIPTNNGWFKPQSVNAFFNGYNGLKSTGQCVLQNTFTMGANVSIAIGRALEERNQQKATVVLMP